MPNRRRRPGSVAAALVLLAALQPACLGTPPEQREPAVQGDFDDGHSEHRPGQPCINCHSDDPLIPLAPPFELGGTVYDEIDAPDNAGVRDVSVIITDAEGREVTARTNRAGNFYVTVDEGLSEPQRRGGGKLEIPWPLAFPLQARIRRGDVETPMETLIWRSRSCASCHGAEESAESVGRVYLDEEAQP